MTGEPKKRGRNIKYAQSAANVMIP